MSPIDECNFSTRLLTLGFLTMVGTNCIQYFWSNFGKSYPINSPPVSCTTLRGRRYRDGHSLPKRVAIDSLFVVVYSNYFRQTRYLVYRCEEFHLFCENLPCFSQLELNCKRFSKD